MSKRRKYTDDEKTLIVSKIDAFRAKDKTLKEATVLLSRENSIPAGTLLSLYNWWKGALENKPHSERGRSKRKTDEEKIIGPLSAMLGGEIVRQQPTVESRSSMRDTYLRLADKLLQLALDEEKREQQK